MSEQSDQPKPVSINTGDEMSRGRYSNSLLVSHTPEEFILDWILNSPGGASLVSRIIVSPGHMKRIVSALKDNLEKYEERLGEIKAIKQGDKTFH